MLLADAQAYASSIGTARFALILALTGVLGSALGLLYVVQHAGRGRALLGLAALFVASGGGLYATFGLYLELADDGQAVYKTQYLGLIAAASRSGEVLEVGPNRYTLLMPSQAQVGEQAHLLHHVNGEKRVCVEGTCFALRRTDAKVQARAELEQP